MVITPSGNASMKVNYFAESFGAIRLPPVPPKKHIIRTGLPDRERAVCARLREARQHLRLTQTEFAKQIGISRERLASYEDARAPLRFDCGLKVCRQFLVNEKWLADGLRSPGPLRNPARTIAVRFRDFPARRFMDLASGVPIDAKMGRIPFRQGFVKVLSEEYERPKLSRGFLADMPKIALSSLDDISVFKNVLTFCTEVFSRYQEESWQKEFFWAMVRWARIVYQELSRKVSTDPPECWFEKALDNIERADFTCDEADEGWFWGYKVVPASPGEMVPLPSGLKDSYKKVLHTFTEFSKSGGMNLNMAALIERLGRLTEPVGMKGKLAKALGVPQPRVSEWLSGKNAPGGETTLKMLRWVQEQESQQNTLGSAINTTKGKTQVRKSVYEKQTQVRKKG
jgi:transcriptional regulator with XRE-family HTH domain